MHCRTPLDYDRNSWVIEPYLLTHVPFLRTTKQIEATRVDLRRAGTDADPSATLARSGFLVSLGPESCPGAIVTHPDPHGLLCVEPSKLLILPMSRTDTEKKTLWYQWVQVAVPSGPRNRPIHFHRCNKPRERKSPKLPELAVLSSEPARRRPLHTTGQSPLPPPLSLT